MFILSSQENRLTENREFQKKFNIFALIVITLFFIAVFCCLPVGIGILDESFYYTMVKRFAEGDRLLIDEWKVNQLFTVFLILPYQIYVRIVGSTEGLILFMRYLFVFCEFVFSVYIYRKLQKYRTVALLFVLMLFTTSPVLTFSYYNITVNCTALIVITLFAEDVPPSKIKLVLVGIIASCAVISHPILTIGYLAYSFQVLFLHIKQKKGAENRKKRLIKPSLNTWSFITFGILISFLVFAVYLLFFTHFSFSALKQNISELFFDPDYSFGLLDENSHILGLLYKAYQAIRCFGIVISIVGILLVIAAIIWRRGKRNRKARAALFALGGFVFFLSYCHLAYMLFLSHNGSYRHFLYNLPVRCFSAPIVVFGLLCLLLSVKPQPKYFAFLQTAVIVSFFVDYSSTFCFSYAGIIALFPMVLCCRELISELYDEWSAAKLTRENAAGNSSKNTTKKKAEKTKRAKIKGKGRKRTKRPVICFQKKQILSLSMAFVVAPVILFGGEMTVVRTLVPRYERFDQPKSSWQPMDQTIDRGPLKGIRTNEQVKTKYDEMLDDMELVKRLANGPLYVHFISPLPYLAVDLPVGTYSVWIDEELRMARSLHYWDLHPDRIPSVIYLPTYLCTNYSQLDDSFIQTEMEKLQALFDCNITEGKAGYILTVNKIL